MDTIQNNTIDLVVTSPPYPMIEMWDECFVEQDGQIGKALEDRDGPTAFAGMHRQLDQVWAECYRTLRTGGFACINIGDATRKIGNTFRLYTNHSRITSFCESLGFQTLPAVLWRKQTNAPNKFMGSGMLPSGAYVTLEHEYILIFRKGDKREFDQSLKNRRDRSAFFWEERNVWFSDIWDFKGTKQTLNHGDARQRSAAFPFELAFRLINMYSMQEDVILDPFVGTGTTILASMASGRSSIGFELDRTLCQVIEETICRGAGSINDRQIQRIRGHEAFLKEYVEQRSHVFEYQNVNHGFAVMTRQETNLSVPVVAKIRRNADSDYRAAHSVFSGEFHPVVVEGFNSTSLGAVQLGLFV